MTKESIDKFFEDNSKEELQEKWKKYDKHSTNFEKLKDYFENTPKEQIEKDWKETEKYDEVGPTVIDFTSHTQKLRTILEGYSQEDIDRWLEEDAKRLRKESKLDLGKMEERIDKILEEDKEKSSKEKYMERVNERGESYTIRTIRNRNKYRFRLRMYKRLWMYALLFIDYLKERIYYYENKDIEDKYRPKWALDKKINYDTKRKSRRILQ